MKLLNEKKRVQLTPRCIRGRIVTYSCLVLSKTLLSTVIVQVQNVPKDQVKSEFNELRKECHLQKWYCLSEFENDLVGKSNQVLTKEYSG
jgi:hypothetical protein